MMKSHLLQEIKRTAQQNGSVPLGQKRFESETGLRRTDWYGKFWARWGDALCEAGFNPNQLQAAYDKNKLWDEFAKLAQELKKIPVSGDLRMKMRKDPAFPSHTTFASRLGSKLKLIEQVRDYCQGHDYYDDVLRMCENYLLQTPVENSETKPVEETIVFVYLRNLDDSIKLEK
jgi:hypothetical protein